MVEEVMAGMRIQPYVHDAIVTVRRGQRLYRFNVFLKNHRLLPINNTILASIPGRRWNGDLVAMKVGEVVPGVVNMSRNDAQLADFAVRQ